MLELRSFDVYKNTRALIIAMLDHLEVDLEVSDAGIETMESNDCRRVLGNDRNANGVLAII